MSVLLAALFDLSAPAQPGRRLLLSWFLSAAAQLAVACRFMAYGEGGQISAITLAMMEELGNYKAQYSAAQCMLWGRDQGCDFVSSRCGVRRDDGGVAISEGQVT